MNTFTGWHADAPALLAGIAADNRLDRWDARHEDVIRTPVRALVADLYDEFGPVRVLRARANRRFRPSAPPLRTDAGAVAGPRGGATLAVTLSAAALTVTAGIHRFDAGQSRRYRAAVAGRDRPSRTSAGAEPPDPDDDPRPGDDPSPGGDPGTGTQLRAGVDPGSRDDPGPGGDPWAEHDPGAGHHPGAGDDPGAVLARLLLDLGLAGLVPDPAGEMRGRPRGVPADHPRLGLLRRRGLQVVRSWPVGPWIATPEPLERVRTAWRSAAPLIAWLDAEVGPAASAPPRPRERLAE